MSTPRERWERVAATITDAVGIAFAVDYRHFPGGTNYFIDHVLPSGDMIGIHDRFWSKNMDVWIGYEVHVEGRDSIVRRRWPITKKRTDVVGAVRDALELVEAA